MEQYKAEEKALKKAYKQAKRAYTGAWKFMGILLAILTLECGVLATAPEQYVGVATSFLLQYGIDGKILSFAAMVCAVAALLCAVGCAVQKKRLKQAAQYLNYRTMLNTMKVQKEMIE